MGSDSHWWDLRAWERMDLCCYYCCPWQVRLANSLRYRMMTHSIRRLDQLIPLHILRYGMFHSMDTPLRMNILKGVLYESYNCNWFTLVSDLSPMAWTRLLSLTDFVLRVDDESGCSWQTDLPTNIIWPSHGLGRSVARVKIGDSE